MPIEKPRFANVKVGNIEYKVYLTSPEIDYIQKGLASKGVPYELLMLEDMRSRLSKDSVVLDIGANIGNHTFYLANVAQCKVVAFEPNDDLAHAMEITVSETALGDRVTIHTVALGEKPGYAEFAQAMPDNLGGQSLRLDVGKIKVKALDSLGIDFPVHVIKLDIEGMELQALKGGRSLIEKYKPVLYVECQTKADFTGIEAYLKEFGYFYQDTFNATPTHLFIHSSDPTYNRRADLIALKQVHSKYESLQIINKLKHELVEVQEKNLVLYDEISTIKSNVSQLQSHSETLEQTPSVYSEITQLEADNERLRKDLVQANLLQAQLEEELEAVRAEQQSQLKEFFRKSSNQRVDLALQENLTAEVERLVKENRSQQALLVGQQSITFELDESRQKIAEMRFILEDIQTENRNLKSELKSKDAVNPNSELQQQYLNVNKQCEQLTHDNALLRQSVEDYEKLALVVSQKETQYNELKVKFDKLLLELEDSKRAVSSLQENLQNELAEKAALGSLEKRVVELENEIGEKEQLMRQLSQQNNNYIKELRSLYEQQQDDAKQQLHMLLQKKLDSLGPLQSNQDRINKLIEYRNSIEKIYSERTPLLDDIKLNSDVAELVVKNKTELQQLVKDLVKYNHSNSSTHSS